MKVAIVGSEAKKFTPAGEVEARAIIRTLLDRPEVAEVISGGCHLGGIDIWAVEIGRELGKSVTEFAPANLNWSTGYKPRNLQIAHRGDECHCITVSHLPLGFNGMRFELCYHCGTRDHVKSGGCWTMKQAAKLGKTTKLHIVKQL